MQTKQICPLPLARLLFALLIWACAGAEAASAASLQVGEPIVESRAGEPLRARIRVDDADAGWLGGVPTARLLPEPYYLRYRTAAPSVDLTDLRVALERADGGGYWLTLASHRPVAASPLPLLVQVSGRSDAATILVELTPQPAIATQAGERTEQHADKHVATATTALLPGGRWHGDLMIVLIMLLSVGFARLAWLHRQLESEGAISLDSAFAGSGERGADLIVPRSASSADAEAAPATGMNEAIATPDGSCIDGQLERVAPAEEPAVTPLVTAEPEEEGLQVQFPDEPGFVLPETASLAAVTRAECPPAGAGDPGQPPWSDPAEAGDSDPSTLEELSALYRKVEDFEDGLQLLVERRNGAGQAPADDRLRSRLASQTADEALSAAELADLLAHLERFEDAVQALDHAAAEAEPPAFESTGDAAAGDEVARLAQLPAAARHKLAEISVLLGKAGDRQLSRWLLEQLRPQDEPDCPSPGSAEFPLLRDGR